MGIHDINLKEELIKLSFHLKFDQIQMYSLVKGLLLTKKTRISLAH